jgi:hypothetical protein
VPLPSAWADVATGDNNSTTGEGGCYKVKPTVVQGPARGFDRLDDCQHGQDCREKLSHRYTLKNKKNKKVNNIIWLLLIFCMEFCL